jgi:hypothetical protein
VVGFFSYGHLYDGLKALGPAVVMMTRHRYLAPSFGVVMMGLAVLLARRPGLGAVVSSWLTAFGWILLAFPLTTLALHPLQESSNSGTATEQMPTRLRPPADSPDVLYVILDGYGRSDVLGSSYGYDNAPFVDFLRSRGFYVAESATSNYSRTLLSLISSLNMDYVDQVLDPDELARASRQTFAEVLEGSRVFELFRQLGYTIVAFESG